MEILMQGWARRITKGTREDAEVRNVTSQACGEALEQLTPTTLCICVCTGYIQRQLRVFKLQRAA